MSEPLEWNALTGAIIGAAIEVHRELGGPGLLEEVYEAALVCELKQRGLKVRRQVAVPVMYKGEPLDKTHILDLLIDDRLVVEIKSTEKHNPVFEAQLLTYLRLTGQPVGLLINFGERHLCDGVRRVVNGFTEGSLCVSAPLRQM